MTNVTTKLDFFEPASETAIDLFDNWFDPIESGVRERVRDFIEALVCGELDAALARPRYGRAKNDICPAGVVGHRHGSRTRSLTGSFGKTEITVPRARLQTTDGRTSEWHSKALRTYQRRTRTADALIASAYLAGTNTRRVRRALAALFRGAVSKDIVSRVWRKIKSDWDAWNARSLVAEPIVRLILDGTAVRVRLDRKATSISLLVVIGVREDGQKVTLAVKNMGGEFRRSLASGARRSNRSRSAAAGLSHRRWRAGIGEGDRRRLGWRAGAALYRSQASQPSRARARASA